MSYWYSQNLRNTFVKEIELQRLISLFKLLIKNHHDGFIISEGDNILMHNDTFNKIFKEINGSNERTDINDQSGGDQTNREQ